MPMRMMLVTSSSIIDGRPAYAGSLVEVDPDALGDMAANLADITGAPIPAEPDDQGGPLDDAAVLPDDTLPIPAEPDDGRPVRRRRVGA